ncbi:hypothetical protein CsSME_00052060 [Camellia sinensis var. sinensis]
MGNQKQKWTTEEEEALRAGVAKHGTGKEVELYEKAESDNSKLLIVQNSVM